MNVHARALAVSLVLLATVAASARAGEKPFPPHPGEVTALAVSPDGKLVATGCGDLGVRVFDAETRALLVLVEGHEHAVLGLAFSPDGKKLASVENFDTVRVTELPAGGAGAAPRTAKAEELANVARSGDLAWSPDGKRIAVATPGQVHLLDVADAKKARVLVTKDELRTAAVAFSPDGKTLAAACQDGIVRVFDAAAGTLVRAIAGHDDDVESVAFSPDGEQLVAGSTDGCIRVWKASSGAWVGTFETHAESVFSIAVAPDGKTVATGSADGIAIHELANGRILWATTHHTTRLAYLAGGTDLVTLSGGHLLVHDVSRARARGDRPPDVKDQRIAFGDPVIACALSPDGEKLAVSTQVMWRVRVYETRTRRRLFSAETGATGATALAFSADGTVFAAGDELGAITLRDATSGAELRKFDAHKGKTVTAVTFLPEGRLLSIADDGARVWDVATGARVKKGPSSRERCTAVAVSPGGLVALAEADDTSRVRLIDAKGAERKALDGPDSVVHAVSFSADGALLATAGEDATIRVYELPEGKLRHSLKTTEVDGPYDGVALSPSGEWVAGSAKNGQVVIFDTLRGALIQKGKEGEGGPIAFTRDGARLVFFSTPRSLALRDVTADSLAARAAFTKATELEATDPDAALAASSEAIRLRPGWSAPYLWRGYLHVDRKDDAKAALADFERAVELGPNEPYAWASLGRVRLFLHDLDAALADLDECLRLSPDYAWGRRVRALARAEKGDDEGAVADLQLLLNGPQGIWALHELAWVQSRLGLIEEALENEDRVIASGAAAANDYEGRARLRALLGDREGAIADEAKALEIEPREQYPPLWIVGLGGKTSSLDGVAAGTSWISNVARFFAKKESEEDLLAEAVKDEKEKQNRLCEAWGYIGLANDPADPKADHARAKACYEACVATGVRNYIEYVWAKNRLAILAGERPRAPRVFAKLKTPVVSHVVFSPDGDTLAASGELATSLVDLVTGKEKKKLRGGAAAFSPDGKVIATGESDGTIHLHALATGEETGVLEGPKKRATAIRFSPDGKTLVSFDEKVVSIFDLETLARRQVVKTKKAVSGIAISPDGKTLAIARPEVGIALHDLASGELQKEHEDTDQSDAGSLAFWPDGGTLTWAARGELQQLDLATGTRRVAAKVSGAESGAGSPDGKSYALAGSALLAVVDAKDGKVSKEIRLDGEVTGTAFAPDGLRVAVAITGGRAIVFDLRHR